MHGIQVFTDNTIITIEDIDTDSERWINRGDPVNIFLSEGYHLKLYKAGNDGDNYINEILSCAFDNIFYGNMLITIHSHNNELTDYKLLFKLMNKNINKVRQEIIEIIENETILNTIKQKQYKY
jgi:hypothetical protein